MVDALLRIGSVNATPPFVEYNTGTNVTIQANIANIANEAISGTAVVELYDLNGSRILSQTSNLLAVSSIAPIGYNLATFDTTTLLTGTYTVTVHILDGEGTVIPQAAGLGTLAVGQAVTAHRWVSPDTVAPGDATVTTIVETKLSQTVLDLVAEKIDQVKRIFLARTIPDETLSPLTTLPPTAPLVNSIPIYNQDFEGTIGSEWSHTLTTFAPGNGTTFLGQFRDDTVTLSLTGLPAHQQVSISLDFYTIGSWDGNNTSQGPELWSLGAQGGPSLLNTHLQHLGHKLVTKLPRSLHQWQHLPWLHRRRCP